MSPVLIGRPAGSERMPNRVDEVLHDPGNESVPNPGEAAQLFAALPKEIGSPEHVGLRDGTAPPDVCLGGALANNELLSQDAHFCTPLLMQEILVPTMA